MLKKLSIVLIIAIAACFALPAAVCAQNGDGPYSAAILDFDTSSSRGTGTSYATDAGTAIPAIMTTELANSPRYNIIEREQLEAVLNEQKLGQSGIVNPETAARIGEVLGVEYLITGKVTEFNIEEGKSSSFTLFGIGGSSKKPNIAHVSIEVKVMDTESARIVAAVNCRGDFEVGKGESSTQILVIQNKHKNSGSNDAALANLYYEIGKDLSHKLNTVAFKSLPGRVKHTGLVIHQENNRVYINMGKKSGISRQSVFLVRREMTKAGTKIKMTVGKIRVITVDEESSECEILEKNDNFKAGDIVETKF